MMQRQRVLFSHAAVVLAISGLALALFLTTPTNGDFWWFDASRHAMNGVFLRDLLMEGGLLHPISFATAYYKQYPAINIGFYPPFMYMSSVPFLAIFGVSHAVSQAVVTLYALAGGLMVYLICIQGMDKLSAAAAALAVLAMPDMALWARQVQLDVPAIALLLATAWSLIRYLQGGRAHWMLATSLFLGLAMLTRVQAGYAAPAVMLFVLFQRVPQRPQWQAWTGAVVLFAILALPAVAITLYFSRINGSLAGGMPNMPSLWTVGNWVWYVKVLPQQVGLAATCFLAVGLLAAAVSAFRGGATLTMYVVAAFALSSWLFFTLVSNKEPRFNLPSLPFLYILAAYGLCRVSPQLARGILLALALWSVYHALIVSQVPVAQGFREAAQLAQAHTPKGRNVLISAHRDGSFIYEMRTMGKRRDIGIRRADKLFVEINIMRQLGIKDQNLDENGIRSILDAQDIDVVVSQTGYLADQPSMQQFQGLLVRGDLFREVGRVSMKGQLTKDEQELVIYVKK
jgi:hypothetical protein